MMKACGSAGPIRILDIGTGSGAIAIALAKEIPDAAIVALDVSEQALAVAQANARSYDFGSRIEFICGDSLHGLPDGALFDAIVSNPPYIPSADIELLEPEIKNFEPRLALDGGPDGLDFYRTVIPHMRSCLKAGGFAALEIGAGQGAGCGGAVCRSRRVRCRAHCEGLCAQRSCRDSTCKVVHRPDIVHPG